MMVRRFFTSESVTEGHPDKICDQISDALLDAFLAQDSKSHVACEVTVTTGLVHVMGEIKSSAAVDVEGVVRNVIRRIGYDRSEYGFDANTCAVIISLHSQSPDITQGVERSLEVREGLVSDGLDSGAGDQGMMIGFACDETEEFMPMPIMLAQKLCMRLAHVRRAKILDYLRPDGKSQVTVEYMDGRAVRVDAVVIASQHAPGVSRARIRRDIIEHVIRSSVPEKLLDDQTRFYVNTTGQFVVGGPMGDSGLTGRKIIVDTYGGFASHGGGAFSGKDPTKVDRTGCYAARHAAKNIVAAGLASSCTIELAYAIGVARPLSVYVNTGGTGKVADDVITELLMKNYDFRPAAIAQKFGLHRPIYEQIAAYGHFGRSDIDLPWERLDMVDCFRGFK